MTSSNRFRKMLSLKREAAAMLEAKGYVVLQFKDQEAPGHLFVTRDDHGILISLMRAHDLFTSIEEVTKCYGGIIGDIRSFPSPEDYHFEIWVFISSTECWQYYRIGHDEVTEVDHGG